MTDLLRYAGLERSDTLGSYITNCFIEEHRLDLKKELNGAVQPISIYVSLKSAVIRVPFKGHSNFPQNNFIGELF